jgi:protein SCO1
VSERRAAIAACVVVLLASGCGSHAAAQHESSTPAPHTHAIAMVHGTPVAAGVSAQDFTLRDYDGKVVQLSALRGRVVLLTFLYTRCPDVCPLLAANLNAVLRTLSPAKRREVRVLAISVDPAHDTPRAVRAFARSHALLPQFRYLVGSKSELKPVWQGYNLVVQPRNAEVTEHSAYVLLIDKTGKPRLTYQSSVGAATVLRDLHRLALA